MAPRPKKPRANPTTEELARQMREFEKRGGKVRVYPPGATGLKHEGRNPLPIVRAPRGK